MKKVWETVKIIGKEIAFVQATVILTLVYWLVVPLFVFFVKKDRRKVRRGWSPWRIRSDTLDDLREQF